MDLLLFSFVCCVCSVCVSFRRLFGFRCGPLVVMMLVYCVFCWLFVVRAGCVLVVLVCACFLGLAVCLLLLFFFMRACRC